MATGNSPSQSVQVGPGALGLLGLLFAAAKIGGYIAWPWWIVLAPFWVPFTILAVLFVLVCIAAVLS